MMLRAYSSVAVTLIALALLAAPSASAGLYTVHNCPASLAPNFDVGSWQPLGGALPSTGGYQSTCTPGSVLGTAVGWFGNEQSLETNIGIILQSPSPRITIRELRLVWSVSHESSGSDTFAQVITDTGYQMFSQTPYAAGATNPFQARFPANTRTVNVYSYCSYDNSTNCYFPSSTYPLMKVEGMDTTLEDSGAPSASAVSGALASVGPLSGTAALQFTAEDQESGVKEAQLLVDGAPVVSHSYAPECPYTGFAACPQSEKDSVTWNTSAVANGEHLLALRVTDAAGNVQTVDSHAIEVSNPVSSVPPGGTGPVATPPACVGSPEAKTTITVSARHNLLQTRYRHRALLSGHLLGPGGKPITSGIVEVLIRPAIGDHPFVSLGHATTRSKGQFKFGLPPGTSRTVCLRYGPEREGHYTSALLVSQRVSAGVTLALHPSVIGPNGTIILTGNVLGGYISPPGKIVELLVHYLGRWRVFETVRSTPSGHFEAFYSFLGGHGRFAFRARVRGENGYLYALGYSRPVRVRAG
jgi:hypothetical protein